MFIPFVSHFPARASRECLVGLDDTTLTSHPGDSSMYLIFVKEPSFTHPLERRKGGGGGGKGKGPSSSSSALSDSLLVITTHPLSTRACRRESRQRQQIGKAKQGAPWQRKPPKR